MTKRGVIVGLFLAVFLSISFPALAGEKKERPPVDVRELLLGHLEDSYHWHFFDIGENRLRYLCR